MGNMSKKQKKQKFDQLWDKWTSWPFENPLKFLAVIVAIVVAYYAIGGAVSLVRWAMLPIKPVRIAADGKPVGLQDNWLVINCAERGEKEEFYHLADFDVPEGFHKDDYSAYDEFAKQDFFCSADDENGYNGVVSNFYVSAAKNTTAAAYVERLLGLGMHKSAGEPTAATIAGKDVHYVYMVFDDSATKYDALGIAIPSKFQNPAYSALCVYMDTPQGSSVSCMINGLTCETEDVADEATLLAQAEIILSGLTLMEK